MEGGEKEVERGGERRRELLLAVSVLQIEMGIEVDEDPLPGLGGGDHPHALLGGRVGARVARGGQVVRDLDLYVAPANVCSTRGGEGGKVVASRLVSNGWRGH